tara:strand:+ start:6439 stop:7146 length:708 start_codon:yes stop_codon:yes gene_type:complete
MKKLLIVIPTYNEKKNIKNLFFKIKKNVKKFDLLFIDDNSPDNTKEEIKKLATDHKNIKLFVRKKKLGIGSAHKFGFIWGYKKKYLKIITMDSDGTHDPKYIKKMLKISTHADIVITNRFLKSNSLYNWPIYRKLLTYLRYYLISYLFNKSYDSSGAFRCYNLNQIKLNHLLLAKNNSYSFFWESILILDKKYSIKEIPIKLHARYLGESKMMISDIIEALKYLIIIYFKLKIKF